MKTQLIIPALCAITALISPSTYAVQNNTTGGFIDFNLYPYLSDVDTDSVATINMGATLKHRLSYFSLTNFSNQANESELEDVMGFYSEQNIRWQIQEGSPIDLTLQMNFRSGDNNDRHRLGARWRLNDTLWLKDFFQAINLSWSINLHALQIDNEDAYVWQLEHTYRMTFPTISKRLYVAGFIDHTFNQDLPANTPSDPAVWETQLGVEMFDNCFAIAEYRLNEYNREDVNNLALGLEYLIKW